MRVLAWTGALFFLLLMAGAARADEVRGQIAYRSAERIFVTLGSEQGAAVGDSLRVERDGNVIGWLLLEHVSSDRSSARPLAIALESFSVGDEVVVETSSGPDAATSETASKRGLKVPRTIQAEPLKLSKTPLTRGRITLRSWALNDRNGFYLQPSLLLTMNGRGAGLVQHSLLIRLDRRINGAPRLPDGSAEVYHAWAGVTLNMPLNPSLRLGRLDVPLAGGVGLVDGGELTAAVRPGIRVGLLAGRTPDLRLEGVRSEGSKQAALLSFEGGEWAGNRYQTGVAWVRESLDAGLDREWIVQNGYFQFGRRVSVSTCIELDLAAADNMGDPGSTQFSSGWLSLRVRINEGMTWSLRGNALKLVRRLETHRSIPDSLWDDAQRYGVYTSFASRSTAGSWSVGLGVRDKERTSTMLFSGFARIDHNDAFFFDRMGGSFRFIRNLFIDAVGVDTYVEEELSRVTTARLNGGVWAYGYGDADVVWLLRPKLEAEVSWVKPRQWFLSGSLGVEADPDSPLVYGFVEIQRSF